MPRATITLVPLFILVLYGFLPSPEMTVTTLAGTGVAGYSGDGGPAARAQLNNPYGISRGPDGGLYICDMGNRVIRQVAPDGTIRTFAGTGKKGYAGDGRPASQAELNEPYEVRFDRQGNMFIIERLNHVVRRIDVKDKTVSTVAGTGKAGFGGDGGPADKAMLSQPHSIQFDHAGNLYICDIGNHRIRRVDQKTGTISTFAGTGEKALPSDGARIDTAPLHGPRAIDFGADGKMWLALREGNAVYRIDVRNGTLNHLAGTGEKGFTGNGGPALLATLSGPKGISVGPDGNIYLADTESHSIRMVDVARNTLELIAGTGVRGDGPEGNPLACKFARPHGVFVDSDGSIYVGDSESHRVRVIRRR